LTVLASLASIAAPASTAADTAPKPREGKRKDRREDIGPPPRQRRHHRHRRPAHWLTALASWYVSDGGPIACGGDSYAMGVANRTLPCGTKLVVCFQRCVHAIVFDRGPYVFPRDGSIAAGR
jgi:hypothetical protein